ncbi:MAG TPA: hypothetical protein VJ023_21620 [Pyrinomonadaceae bacterium]|nr:hypothetical protein [Pyrinomonadaceae bacterium]
MTVQEDVVVGREANLVMRHRVGHDRFWLFEAVAVAPSEYPAIISWYAPIFGSGSYFYDFHEF